MVILVSMIVILVAIGGVAKFLKGKKESESGSSDKKEE